jgi:regulator of sirC expression with transglutaminase-like and TPR domain
MLQQQFFFGSNSMLTLLCSFLQALRADPSDRKMLANRSLCWLRLGDGQKALEDAIKCKLSNKDSAEAHHREGEALIMLKVH